MTLFDLDHTLIPCDSTMGWMRFLVDQGEIDSGYLECYLACCRQYVAGLADISALQQAALAPLVSRSVDEVRGWQARFAEQVVSEALPAAATRLVERHAQAGELCCLVTNTSDVVASRFASALGVGHLLSTRAETAEGRFTGGVCGEPCYGPGKIRHVVNWLASNGQAWGELEHSRFYSDSITDLPLLSYVAEPIAVAPDRQLRAHALAEGWRIAETLDNA